MQTGKRGLAWCWLLVALGVVECLSVAGGAQEPLLLQRATRIASVKGPDVYSDYCVWLSDHDVISVDYRQLDWHKPPVIAFHDLTTGKTHKVPFVRWPVSTHTEVVCSGDGRWALCLDTDGPEPHTNVIGMDLQTGRTLEWPSLGDPYHLPNHWLSDSRRWLQFPTLEKGYFNVYSVDAPTKVDRLDFPDAPDANWRTHGHFLTNRDHLIIYNDPGIRREPWTKLDIREYRLFPSITLLSKHHFYPPAGQQIEAVSFSPAGDRFAWIVGEQLWVSKLDGTDRVEIGRLPAEGWGKGQSLIWLPDGKRLSFVYNDSLYTVPVDAKRRDAVVFTP
jgi:hypothetical protein